MRAKTPTPDDKFRAALAASAALMDLEQTEVIARSGMRQTTFYDRRRNPGRLSMEDFRRMVRVFGFTDRQVCEIVGVAYHGSTT